MKIPVIPSLIGTLACCCCWSSPTFALTLQSSAFDEFTSIPKQYTCDGTNLSPPLSWDDLPEKTASLVISLTDADASTKEPFVHWVVYNISPTTTNFLDGKARTSGTDGSVEYKGPCPPPGKGEHRYYFTLYALDLSPLIPNHALATVTDIELALQNHVLAEVQLVGFYERKMGESRSSDSETLPPQNYEALSESVRFGVVGIIITVTVSLIVSIAVFVVVRRGLQKSREAALRNELYNHTDDLSLGGQSDVSGFLPCSVSEASVSFPDVDEIKVEMATRKLSRDSHPSIDDEEGSEII